MKVFIVGTGTEGEASLTKRAGEVIQSAGILIGAERMLTPFRELGKEMFCSYRPAEIADKIRNCGCDTAAVLMSGDCGFFSGAKKLLSLLEDVETELIAGISSMQYFCSKTGVSYEKMKFISLHGRESSIAVNVKLNECCFFLLGGKITAAGVCERLCRYGMPDARVCIGSDLGYPQERIISGTAEELRDTEVSGLSVMTAENSSFSGHIPSCIDDSLFIRGNIPMTKSEVRCIAVSKLGIRKDSVVWDIGCGTGSVSVEAAYCCHDGAVFSFDKKPEAVSLTEENSRIFGCDNIFVYEGSCPEILKDAPKPDKVFIGGSSGEMKGIFDAVRSKTDTADIVVTAVSLETLQEAVNCFEYFGAVPEIVQIAVTRTHKAGTHTMLQAQNPVFIISGRIS